ncbi:hypothetical protein DFLDMN_000733 [Cupriavidus sp. H19C3]|uniref:hypothetical protein n=1 Tax=Cupriavidus sp. H19C3 TaxID=3241603 RepID=UPI003BF87938
MKLQISAKCPHCGAANQVAAEAGVVMRIPHFVLCDVDEGGCDEHFVVLVRVAPDVIVARIVEVNE